MDITQAVLMWLHIATLALGGAAGFAIPVLGAAAARADGAVAEALGGRIRVLQRMGHTALGLFILTGLGLLWLGEWAALANGWFRVKLVLVALLVLAVAGAARSARRAQAGDAAAAARMPAFSAANILLMLGIVFAAVRAFG